MCLEPELLGVAIPVLAGAEYDRIVEAAAESLRVTATRLLQRWELPPPS